MQKMSTQSATSFSAWARTPNNEFHVYIRKIPFFTTDPQQRPLQRFFGKMSRVIVLQFTYIIFSKFINKVLLKSFLNFLRCFGIEMWRFKAFKKISIKSQIEVHDINFYISNKGVYTLYVELRSVVLRLRKKYTKNIIQNIVSWKFEKKMLYLKQIRDQNDDTK